MKDDTTRLLNRFGGGDRSVEPELLEAVYRDLHALAAAHMRDQPAAHTLQPTALIHEAWMRLARQEELSFDARKQFFRLASQTMRSVLVDHVRKGTRRKRGGDHQRIAFEELEGTTSETDADKTVDLLALEDCLVRLEEAEPELCRLVEMRFFGGLTHPQIAEALDLPLRRVERQWRAARAWLQAEMSG